MMEITLNRLICKIFNPFLILKFRVIVQFYTL